MNGIIRNVSIGLMDDTFKVGPYAAPASARNVIDGNDNGCAEHFDVFIYILDSVNANVE